MEIWIATPKDIGLKLANINAKKLASFINNSKNVPKELKQLAKEINDLVTEG